MGTGFTLRDEASREERLQQAWEVGHVFHQIPSQRLSNRCPTRRHQFRRAGHIPVGVGDMSVTEIRRQNG